MSLVDVTAAVDEVDVLTDNYKAEDREEELHRGHGGVSGTYETRIDISDVTRYFQVKECSELSNETRRRITEEPM